MVGKVKGWSYEDKPKHDLFCEKCKYLFTVVTHLRIKEKAELKFSDIYESCSLGPTGKTAYILNHSNEPGDYHSGIELKSLIGTYIAQSKGWFVKEKYNETNS